MVVVKERIEARLGGWSWKEYKGGVLGEERWVGYGEEWYG